MNEPAGFRSFDKDADAVKFPFSGYMDTVPGHTLGLNFPGKSIAVGNRSMFMHMAFGVDISIECFARNLFNQGCMAVVHRDDKLKMRKARMKNRPIKTWLLLPAVLFLAGLLVSDPASAQDLQAQKLADLENRITQYTIQPGFPDDPYGLIVVKAALDLFHFSHRDFAKNRKKQ